MEVDIRIIKEEAIKSLEDLSEGDLIEFDPTKVEKLNRDKFGIVENINREEGKIMVYTAHKRECGVIGFNRGVIEIRYTLENKKLKENYSQSFFAFDSGFNKIYNTLREREEFHIK